MPLIITCTKCKKQFALTEQERKVFWEVTKEERQNIVCPNCVNDSYYGGEETDE